MHKKLISFQPTPLEKEREELKRLVNDVTLESLPAIDVKLRTIGYYLRYDIPRRPYVQRESAPLGDIRCAVCGKGHDDNVAVYNFDRRWLCPADLPRTEGFVIGESPTGRAQRLAKPD